ncbi:MAG: TATA-box-binding protein [Candidatus Undinarchaeales archaeon]|nr:TATA-box-binding protein [Candidatus Undinarchaeales archaeon]
MTKIEITVENIVASINLHCRIPLERVAALSDNAEYNPEQFPGLVFRIQEPKTANLLFGTGKAVCTGGKSLDDVKAAVGKVKESLAGFNVKFEGEPDIEVVNLVASVKTDLELNLDRLAYKMEGVEYEPEQFPGMVFRTVKPKAAILIFSTGRFVVAGTRNIEDARVVFDMLLEKLRDIGEINP